jgi:hypothetical protein
MSTHCRISATGMAFCVLAVAGQTGCVAADNQTEDTTQPTITASRGDVAAIDEREAIVVDAAARFSVLSEMRAMLIAVQGIVGGAGRGDTAAMRTMASSVGLAAATEANETVAAQLGPAFVQLGMLTHANFDSLAVDIARGKRRDAVLNRLATVMGNCVGCHSKYRLVVNP